jgi:hypothetical protein
MNNARSYQPARRTTRVAAGLFGAVIGLGIVTSVIESMGGQSGGQSLGQFVATQRAIANHPLAQVTVPAALEAPAASAARDAV